MSGAAGPGSLRGFGDFTFDPAAGELWRGAARIRLQRHSAWVLDELTSRPGEVVTREELVRRIWPKGVVEFDAGLNTAVRRLRMALGDDAEVPRFIETLPRRGYRFVQSVTSLERAPARKRPHRLLAAGVLALATALAFGAWQWRSRQAPAVESIAVLPLKNLADDPAQQYFVDGLTDELITRLAKLRSLRVVSRTTVFTYRTAGKTLPEIARELGVDAIVEGSVLRDGDRLRVTVQLIRADDVHLWADSFEAELEDVLRLQRDITIQVARQVQVVVDPASVAERPVIPEAYEAYLRGRHLWNTFRVANWAEAAGEYERAIAIDPGFAPAWSGLADTHLMSVAYSVQPAHDGMPKARDAARKALELDPTLASAYVTLGHVQMAYEWDWVSSRESFERGLALDPAYALGHHWYANWFTAHGRLDEAIRLHERARALEPQSLIINVNVCRAHLFARRYEEAISRCESTRKLDPTFAPAVNWLFEAYRRKGDTRAAMAVWQEYLRATGDVEAAEQQATELGELGFERYLRTETARMIASHRDRGAFMPAALQAEMQLVLGEPEAALALLEQALRDRDFYLLFTGVAEEFQPVWSHPRFRRVRDAMGLPQIGAPPRAPA